MIKSFPLTEAVVVLSNARKCSAISIFPNQALVRSCHFALNDSGTRRKSGSGLTQGCSPHVPAYYEERMR